MSNEIKELPGSGGSNGGMNGLRDVVAALSWLKQHAVSFGGDGDRITLMGESSGGMHVSES